MPHHARRARDDVSQPILFVTQWVFGDCQSAVHPPRALSLVRETLHEDPTPGCPSTIEISMVRASQRRGRKSQRTSRATRGRGTPRGSALVHEAHRAGDGGTGDFASAGLVGRKLSRVGGRRGLYAARRRARTHPLGSPEVDNSEVGDARPWKLGEMQQGAELNIYGIRVGAGCGHAYCITERGHEDFVGTSHAGLYRTRRRG
jgi:hypothetical protein